mmetsp:Transcript_11174/g.16955  ORF Transcript_11174/g.16955 Transcript_11174/m.16955 type:complete len:84 (-) Transcript_11174:816-1067(-)
MIQLRLDSIAKEKSELQTQLQSKKIRRKRQAEKQRQLSLRKEINSNLALNKKRIVKDEVMLEKALKSVRGDPKILERTLYSQR